MPVELSFREWYKGDINTRILDSSSHLVAGGAAVYFFNLPWYYSAWQFFPDIFLLLLFPYSMMQNRFVKETNLILLLHHLMHLWASPVILAVFLLGLNGTLTTIQVFFIANWLIHILIDACTHEKEEA